MKAIIYIAVLFLSLEYCSGQMVTVNFKGKIYNDKNAGIAGANIQVVQDAYLTNSTQTDVDGNYNLYLPLNREFDITITKAGYVQKKYFVSTKGIKEEEVSRFPTYVADVVLFTHYEGVDYSLFDQPINKYAYNPKNNNIDFDEAYLKNMKEAMKEVKKAEKEAIKAAHEKEINDKKLLAQAKVGYVPQRKAIVSKPVIASNPQDNVVVISTTVNKKEITDTRVLALLERYKPGITEEIIEGKNVYIIQRVVVKDEDVWIYQKKIFTWGGTACFRDKTPITEGIFDQETSKDYNSALSSK